MMGIGPRGLFTSLHSPALSTWGVGSGKWECARCPYHVCIRPSATKRREVFQSESGSSSPVAEWS